MLYIVMDIEMVLELVKEKVHSYLIASSPNMTWVAAQHKECIIHTMLLLHVCLYTSMNNPKIIKTDNGLAYTFDKFKTFTTLQYYS